MLFHTDFLTFFFLFYCVLYNLFLCGVFLTSKAGPSRKGQASRTPPQGSIGEEPVITLMIPALNEEKVLRRTVETLIGLPSPGRVEVLVIDDRSDDRTPVIGEELKRAHDNVDLLRRNGVRSRRGKGDSLNHGLAYLLARNLTRDLGNWVIGVFDADGRPAEDDLLVEVGRTFADPRVAAAQCGVRIRNGKHLLAALQDVEFATFSFVTQTVRNRTSGAVALGGNGQFIRASTLRQLSQRGPCWDQTALTEDLDVGTRIHIAGGTVRFLDRWIEQEGVETLRALFRQRRRWAWGTLQVFFRYVLSGRLIRARMAVGKKLDLHYYLSFWVVPFVVLLSLFLSLLDLAGVITITNSFGLAFLWANSFSFVPVIVLGLLWARIPLRKMIYLVPLTVIYTYHWIPVLVLALASIIGRKQPYWAKTERFVVDEVAG